MHRKGFTLVEIMIVVAIIALLVAIAISSLSVKRTDNTATAKANIRALSVAAEAYATAHSRVYPVHSDGETEIKEYIAQAPKLCAGTAVQGYIYNCSGLAANGYTLTATPASATDGDTTFSVTTGGVIKETAYVAPKP